MDLAFCTVGVEVGSRKKDYLEHSYKLADSVLTLTQHPFYLLTNKPEYYDNLKCDRLFVYDTKTLNLTLVKKGFNQFLKGHILNLTRVSKSEYIIFLDGDANLNKWDENLIKNLLAGCEFDISGRQIYCCYNKYINTPTIHHDKLHKRILKFDKRIPALQETHIIFKNTKKLDFFTHYMLEFEKNNLKNNARMDSIGIYVGLSAALADLEIHTVAHNAHKGNPSWIDYFKQYELNHLGKTTTIVSRI